MPGFEISDNLDWTAIGTMALAIVTGASLLFGRKALRQGQKEVEEAHRPVVVPVVDKTFIDLGSDGSFEKGPQLMRDHRALVIPVENIGSGPALHVEAALAEWDGPAGRLTGYGMGDQTPAAVAGLRVGVLMPLSLRISPQVAGPGLSGFRVSITYEDVAKTAWVTTARYVPEHGRYSDVSIDPIKAAAPGFRGDSDPDKPTKTAWWRKRPDSKSH